MDGINCTNCKHRIGNYCIALDQRLELLEVEKELKFKKPENAPENAKEEKNDDCRF